MIVYRCDHCRQEKPRKEILSFYINEVYGQIKGDVDCCTDCYNKLFVKPLEDEAFDLIQKKGRRV